MLVLHIQRSLHGIGQGDDMLGFCKKHDYHDLTAMLNGEDKRIRKAAKRQIKRMTERGVT